MFRYETRAPDLLRELLQAEVAREADTPTLFRATSLSTTLMDIYMKAECNQFLQVTYNTLHSGAVCVFNLLAYLKALNLGHFSG